MVAAAVAVASCLKRPATLPLSPLPSRYIPSLFTYPPLSRLNNAPISPLETLTPYDYPPLPVPYMEQRTIQRHDMHAYVQSNEMTSTGRKRGGPALWIVSSSMVAGLLSRLFLYLDRLSLWAPRMCTWGLWSWLYSCQLPLVYTPRSVSKNVYPRPPFHLPHPRTLSPHIFHHLLPLSLYPILSCLVFLAVLIRFNSAMLFARLTFSCSLFIVHPFSLLSFISSFLVFAHAFRSFRPLQGFFSSHSS